MPLFVKVLSGLQIDEADGIDHVPETEFRERLEVYEQAWRTWRGLADGHCE